MSLPNQSEHVTFSRVGNNVPGPSQQRSNQRHKAYKTPEFVHDSDDDSSSPSPSPARPRFPAQQRPTVYASTRTYSGIRTRPNILRRNRMPPVVLPPDPLENLPNDLSRNFSKWFYGDLNELKQKSRTNLRPVVERYIGNQNNPKLNPNELKFMTEDLNYQHTPSEINQLIRYKMSLEEGDERNATAGSIYIESRRKKSNPTTSPCDSNSNNISIIIQPEIVIVDRRPLFKKRTAPVDNNQSQTLIQPEEDCDDTDDELEFIEIDCDT